jgi:hypothetical protein
MGGSLWQTIIRQKDKTMSKLKITLEDGKDRHVLVLSGTNTPTIFQAIDTLLDEPNETQDETTVIKSFLNRTGASVSIETPESSHIAHILFNEVSQELTFEFDNGSLVSYPAAFSDFLEAVDAPSAGRLEWAYRRGQK